MIKIIIDYGKPYEEEFNTEEEVLNYLKNLHEEEYPYFDIEIFKGDLEITEEIFNKLEGLK